ncbi:cytochrome P450 [Marasmius fiardii PR-910]|nr:cytochrome P450 [Marasmius fiardii PR-910]
MTRPFFSKDRVRDFEIFDTHAIETIRQMQVRMSGGHPIDFQDVVARFTLDCATEFLFGKNVESLAAGLPYPKHSGICNPASFTEHVSNPFTTAFSEGQNIITRRNRTGKTWPLMEFWRDEAAERRKVVEEFARPLLDEAKKSILHDANEKRNSDGETFLQHLVHFTQDDKVIMDSIINILLASRDTTASLLTFALYMLTEHRDLAQRMRDEVMEHVGETKSPTYEDIRGMKLMRAFLNETLRLYPPAPNNSRTSVKATTLVNENGPPLFVPENCKVMYNVFLIHRRRDLWGPDADQFDPDRFLDERLHRYLVPNPFIFLPFGAGPRICLGQQFACNETSFFLVRLLQNFKSFTLALEAQPEFCKPPADWKGYPGTKGRDKIVPTAHLTMSVKGGLWVRME